MTHLLRFSGSNFNDEEVLTNYIPKMSWSGNQSHHHFHSQGVVGNILLGFELKNPEAINVLRKLCCDTYKINGNDYFEFVNDVYNDINNNGSMQAGKWNNFLDMPPLKNNLAYKSFMLYIEFDVDKLDKDINISRSMNRVIGDFKASTYHNCYWINVAPIIRYDVTTGIHEITLTLNVTFDYTECHNS